MLCTTCSAPRLEYGRRDYKYGKCIRCRYMYTTDLATFREMKEKGKSKEREREQEGGNEKEKNREQKIGKYFEYSKNNLPRRTHKRNRTMTTTAMIEF